VVDFGRARDLSHPPVVGEVGLEGVARKDNIPTLVLNDLLLVQPALGNPMLAIRVFP
jgi:hypothetical protein